MTAATSRTIAARRDKDGRLTRGRAAAALTGRRQRRYCSCPYMVVNKLERELKRGSAELLILALLEERQRHGYEIGQLIAQRSDGAISFHVTSLYPTLYRLEDRGWIEGRWVERAGQRRRRYYKLTRTGRQTLASQRNTWQTFLAALNRVAKINAT